MNLMPFQDQPFNGDTYICDEFLKLKEKHNIFTAVETGSCMYSSTKWLCENFDEVYTVEINHEYANYGKHKILEFNNCFTKVGIDSVGYLSFVLGELIDKTKGSIFFLDAHWGENCPLKDEIKAIAGLRLEIAPVIAIHDFYTNHPEELGYDTYKSESLSFDYIQNEVRMLELAYGCNYNYYYNTPDKSIGAKRGIIYLTPKF